MSAEAPRVRWKQVVDSLAARLQRVGLFTLRRGVLVEHASVLVTTPVIEISLEKPVFPSPELREPIQQLGHVNASSTQFINHTPRDIVDFVRELEGHATIDITQTSDEEITVLEQAKDLGNQNGVTIDLIRSSETDLLRNLTREALAQSQIRDAFKEFMHTLVVNPANNQLIIDEWNLYIVNHPQTRSATSPLETHHFHNVGLKTDSEGEDPLRGEVITFLESVMREYGEQILQLTGFSNHQTASMNEPYNRLLAICMAEWSNFLRGYYLFLRGQSPTYAPRQKALDIILARTKQASA